MMDGYQCCLTKGAVCGSGLITLFNYAIIPYYFEQRLAMATGVSRVGNGRYHYMHEGPLNHQKETLRMATNAA